MLSWAERRVLAAIEYQARAEDPDFVRRLTHPRPQVHGAPVAEFARRWMLPIAMLGTLVAIAGGLLGSPSIAAVGATVMSISGVWWLLISDPWESRPPA